MNLSWSASCAKSQGFKPSKTGQEVAAHCHGHCHELSFIMTQENSQEITVTQIYDRKQTSPMIQPWGIPTGRTLLHKLSRILFESCCFLRSWQTSWHYKKDKYSQHKSDGVVRKSPHFWGRMMKYSKAEWPERLPLPGNENEPERTSAAGSVWTSSADHTQAAVQLDTERQNDLVLTANNYQEQEKSVLWVLPHTFRIVICSTIQPDTIHLSNGTQSQ